MILKYLFPVAHSRLIRQFTSRDINNQYRGSIAGLGWAFLTPLLMLGAYYFAFRIAFNTRWPSDDDSDINFALQIYAGLVIYNLFADSLRRAPRAISGHVNFVKKVVFPIEILPWSIVLSSLFHTMTGLLTLIVITVLDQRSISISLISLPIVVGSMLPLMLGLTWLISSLGVYIRDMSQITSLITRVMLFLSPVFFPLKILPTDLQHWLHVNPIAAVIEQTRIVIIDGRWPDWEVVAISWLTAIIIACLGAYWFNYVRKGFADVL